MDLLALNKLGTVGVIVGRQCLTGVVAGILSPKATHAS
jgi:hypothetical protein